MTDKIYDFFSLAIDKISDHEHSMKFAILSCDRSSKTDFIARSFNENWDFITRSFNEICDFIKQSFNEICYFIMWSFDIILDATVIKGNLIKAFHYKDLFITTKMAFAEFIFFNIRNMDLISYASIICLFYLFIFNQLCYRFSFTFQDKHPMQIHTQRFSRFKNNKNNL